jgi:hypothetical protein
VNDGSYADNYTGANESLVRRILKQILAYQDMRMPALITVSNVIIGRAHLKL